MLELVESASSVRNEGPQEVGRSAVTGTHEVGIHRKRVRGVGMPETSRNSSDVGPRSQ